MSRFRYSSFFSASILVLVALAWSLFLPIQFGGLTSYAVINGNSMEPLYHKGDLVIVRKETSYAVGEIVTYYNLDLRRNVIHRIVAYRAGLFEFKGDHNDWVDNDRAPLDRIVGKAWIFLPGLGDFLVRLQTPLGLALLAGLTSLVIFSVFAPRDRRWRVRRKKILSGARSVSFSLKFNPGHADMKTTARQLETIIFFLIILFSISLFLAVSAFSKAETISDSTKTEYLQIGRFSYNALAQPGVYDAAGPTTGDPVFLKTTCQVNLRFDYSLGGHAPTEVNGTISLLAKTRDQSGWVRTFELVPPVKFTGSKATVQGVLNPCQIMETLHQAEIKTELHRLTYDLILIPKVSLTGLSNSLPVEATFEPRLLFYLDDFQMYVVPENPELDPLAPFSLEEISQAQPQPNTIPLPGFAITVHLARILGLIGLVISLGLGAFTLLNIFREMKTDPSLGITLRYGTLIVDVSQVSFDLRAKEIVVNSFEDIVKLAERNTTAILRLEREDVQEFLVEGNNVVYRYKLPKRGKNVSP